MPSVTSIKLFGGAITADIPSHFIDASQFRQVPDHQEVLLDTSSKEDRSIIIEILERVPENDNNAAKAHFDALAHDNEAEDNAQVLSVVPCSTEEIPHLPNNVSAYILTGTQQVVKFYPRRRGSEDLVSTGHALSPAPFVVILLALIRLPQQETDIVISMNIDFIDMDDMLSVACLGAPSETGTDTGLTSAFPLSGGTGGATRIEKARRELNVILSSFTIQDWGLFGGQ
ncbi:hypothetical protein YB2330_000199 [Saitoella coloradoensis]